MYEFYLRDDDSEGHKAKVTKECVKKKLKLENYKSCLEAIQLKNKYNYLEKKLKLIWIVLKKTMKKFKKNKKLISKLQQRLKSERCKTFN